MNYKYNLNRWTSDLCIESDVKLDLSIIDRILDDIKSRYYDKKVKYFDLELIEGVDSQLLYDFASYRGEDEDLDCTGFLKGLAIFRITKYIHKLGGVNYYINFGGDIECNDTSKPYSIKLSNKLTLITNKPFNCFTSGNNDERGNHIVTDGSPEKYNYYTCTYFSNKFDPIMADMNATANYSSFSRSGEFIYINKDGDICENFKGYCASPFFCKYDEIERDMMCAHSGIELFRPDLANNNLEFEGDRSDIDTQKIFKDNTEAIEKSDYLLFPRLTKDLGTLMEVGYALGKGIKIMRFDYYTDTYTIVNTRLEHINPDEDIILDFSDLPQVNAVLFGYCVAKNLKVKYYLGNNRDNIMLSSIGEKLECMPKYSFMRSDLINDILFLLGISKESANTIITSVS